MRPLTLFTAAALTAVLFLFTLGCPSMSHSDEHEEGTNPPGDHNYFDFGDTGGNHGDDDTPTGDDDDVSNNACQEYVDIVCACEGVEDFYEAIGTTCADTYQPLVDEGDPEACELAMDAFYAAGGCDQFGDLGDDDDTD